MRFMIKIILILWLLGIHTFAVLALVDSDLPYRIDRKLSLGFFNPREITLLYEDMLGSHLQLDGSVAEGSVIFLGDSLTQGLNVAEVTNHAINFGIGMDTSVGLLKRIPEYKSLNRASTIVIAIGINDMLRKQRNPDAIIENYKKILDLIPPDKTVIMQATFPVDESMGLVGFNKRIITYNEKMESLAKEKGHLFLNIGSQLVGSQGGLKANFHIGDGLHLSTEAYALWIKALNKNILSASNRINVQN